MLSYWIRYSIHTYVCIEYLCWIHHEAAGLKACNSCFLLSSCHRFSSISFSREFYLSIKNSGCECPCRHATRLNIAVLQAKGIGIVSFYLTSPRLVKLQQGGLCSILCGLCIQSSWTASKVLSIMKHAHSMHLILNIIRE